MMEQDLVLGQAEKVQEEILGLNEAMGRVCMLFKKYPHSNLCLFLYDQYNQLKTVKSQELEHSLQKVIEIIKIEERFEMVCSEKYDYNRYRLYLLMYQKLYQVRKDYKKQNNLFEKMYNQMLLRREWLMTDEEIQQAFDYSAETFMYLLLFWTTINLGCTFVQEFFQNINTSTFSLLMAYSAGFVTGNTAIKVFREFKTSKNNLLLLRREHFASLVKEHEKHD